MKILVVFPQPPGLEAGAPARGAVALLRGLAQHGIEVRGVAAKRYPAAEATMPADLPVEVVDLDHPPLTGARYLFGRLRYPRGSLVGPFTQRVFELAPDYDVIHLDETETAWCNRGTTVPASLHIHFRSLKDRRVPVPWKHDFRYLAEYAVAEIVAARRYKSLVANSSHVADSLRKLNRRADIVVAPFALEPSHYPAAPLDGPPIAGVIGSGFWPPTANAIYRLMASVWPRVHRAVPDAKLLVAGRGTASLRDGREPVPAAEFLGEVGVAAEFLGRLSLLLYPASRGSGVKVKVLEAMACGLPIVTTPRGAEGVAPNDGIVVCEDDDELAAVAARLLSDADERRERGAAARATFLRDHSPARAAEPLVDLFRRMADSSG